MLFNGQNDRVEELNRDIYERYKPDAPLEMSFEARPVSTKYAHFPVVDRRKEAPLMPLPNFRLDGSFTPPVGKGAPFSGYAVDTEAQLQNRFFALQKHGSGIQNQYIPDTSSDLYYIKTLPSSERKKGGDPQEQHPRLGRPYTEPLYIVLPSFIEKLKMSDLPFHNKTRIQLRYDATQNK